LKDIEKDFLLLNESKDKDMAFLENILYNIYQIERFDTINAQKGFKKVLDNLYLIKKNVYYLLSKYM